MSLLSPADRALVQDTLDETYFEHRYTRTTGTLSAEDAHGDVHRVPGAIAPAQPCRFVDNRSPVTLSPGGFENVNRPRLSVPHDDPLDEGDQVSAIVDGDGTVLFAGPAIAEDLFRVAAGAGGGVLQWAMLREVREL